MPLTIELSFVDDHLESIVSNLAFVTSEFTNANTSTTWHIQHVQAKYEIVTLGSGQTEAYIKMLEEGDMTLNYNTVRSQYESIL